jgi:hypothetical protein
MVFLQMSVFDLPGTTGNKMLLSVFPTALDCLFDFGLRRASLCVSVAKLVLRLSLHSRNQATILTSPLPKKM